MTAAAGLSDFQTLAGPDYTLQGDETASTPDELTLRALRRDVRALAKLLAAAKTHAALVILQGMDASGKDAVMDTVFGLCAPQTLAVTFFRTPSDLDRQHDFLWRTHRETPSRGVLGLWHRSHYEDVLYPVVHGQIDAAETLRRYRAIRDFERNLVESGTILLKFYLAVSYAEQGRRLANREAGNRWKLSPSDLEERAYFDAYQRAYTALVDATHTTWGSWRTVPADDRLARNLGVARATVNTLALHATDWLAAMQAR